MPALVCLLLLSAAALPAQSGARRTLSLDAPATLVVGDSLHVRFTTSASAGAAIVRIERDIRIDSGGARRLAPGRWRVRFDSLLSLRGRREMRVHLPLWALQRVSLVEVADSIPLAAVRVTGVVAADTQRVLVRLRGRADDVRVTHIREHGLDGAYGRPGGPGPHPLLIVLHGSEGGDSLAAARQAARFASRGFATFALNYVMYAYDRPPLPGVPSAFLNIPVEMVDRARERLAREPEVDTSRTGLLGVSKGAEFALVIAAARSWPRAVVACVPSDVVWSGFGAPATTGVRYSSWSDGGRPMAYIPYDRYDDVFRGVVTARDVHDRSRVLYADSVEAARIPVERITATTLLIGATRDEVWSSADMADRVAGSMRRAGRNVELLTIENGGHAICGDGITPAILHAGAELPTRSPPDPTSTAKGNAESWPRTLGFLRRSLR
jgi:dienelactone hydrolase